MFDIFLDAMQYEMGNVGVLDALFCRIGKHCWNSRPARSVQPVLLL